MKSAMRLALLSLLLCAPAKAQEVQFGNALICDTAQQVEQFVAHLDGDVQSAVSAVNAAEHDPTACVVATVAYVPVDKIATARNKDRAFDVVRILVIAIETRDGIQTVAPAAFFSISKIEEVGA